MLNFLKKIFVWWNQETISTKIKTIFSGKLVGKDNFGNKYYENKKGKRWVIYAEEIDASKIPVEWYSWMHFTPNILQNNHDPKKYTWQKTHKPNMTGTDQSYHPNKEKNETKKKYKSWKS